MSRSPGSWIGVLPELRLHARTREVDLTAATVVPELGTVIAQAAQAAPFASALPADLRDKALVVARERLKKMTDTDEFGADPPDRAVRKDLFGTIEGRRGDFSGPDRDTVECAGSRRLSSWPQRGQGCAPRDLFRARGPAEKQRCLTMNETGRSRAAIRMGPLSVAVVMTGGTIAKSYHPGESRLYNFEPKVKEIIDGLRLDDLRFTYVDLMQNDSLDIHDDDRKRITRAVTTASRNHDGVLVTHGTDSMRASGDALCAQIAQIQNPVILTGAMVSIFGDRVRCRPERDGGAAGAAFPALRHLHRLSQPHPHIAKHMQGL